MIHLITMGPKKQIVVIKSNFETLIRNVFSVSNMMLTAVCNPLVRRNHAMYRHMVISPLKTLRCLKQAICTAFIPKNVPRRLCLFFMETTTRFSSRFFCPCHMRSERTMMSCYICVLFTPISFSRPLLIHVHHLFHSQHDELASTFLHGPRCLVVQVSKILGLDG